MADYIVNMGGFDNSEYRTTVDVFNVTKNRIEMVTGHDLALRIGRDEVAAAVVNNYILALGGGVGWAGGYTSAVDIFKATENGIEQITDHGLSLSQARCTAAAAAGNYVLAMGGYDGHEWLDTVDVFKVTENGVEEITEHGLSLSTERYQLSAAAAGNYVLAMGGFSSSGYSNAVDVFHVTENGVEAVTGHGLSLSVARNTLAAASCGDYILAMGGNGSSGRTNAVDVFKVTENGVEAVTGHGLSLSVARSFLAAASCGDYILAMGGLGSSSRLNTVDVFKVTENGVEAVPDHGLTLSVGRGNLAAAAAGDFVLALGGRGTGYLNTIDVFQIINK